MTDYHEWARAYPQAATALAAVLHRVAEYEPPATPRSEAAVQQAVRFEIARRGGLAWRNNVGATPAKCPDCGAPRQPVRYGLANDSAQLNARVKSSDIIAAIPLVIAPHHVGTRIAQFAAYEIKHEGWQYRGDKHEAAQAAFLSLVAGVGGLAQFTTGDI